MMMLLLAGPTTQVSAASTAGSLQTGGADAAQTSTSVSAAAWLQRYRVLAATAPANCPRASIPRLDESVPTRAFILEPNAAEQFAAEQAAAEHASGPLIATLKDPITERFILLSEDADGCVQVSQSGRAVPFDWRAISSPFPNARLPDSFGATPALAIVQDPKVIRAWVEVVPLHQFSQQSDRDWALLGMFTGMLICSMVAAILIARSQGGTVIWAYFVYIIGLLFYQFQALGLGRVWLPFWPPDSAHSLMQALATGTAVLGMTLVIVLFLEPRGRLRIALLTSAGLTSGAFFCSAIDPNAYRLAAAALLVMAIPVIRLVVLRLQTGEASVRWFALGIVATSLGGGTQALSILTQGAWLPPETGFATLFGNVIEAICWLLAIVLRTKEQQDALHRQLIFETKYDSLTSSYNRRYIRKRIALAIAEARRTGGGASGLLYIDLCGFKEIKDRFGQSVGDEALCRFSSILQGMGFKADAIGRYGGHEFVILMRHDAHWGHTEGAAATILARFQDALELDEQSILIRPDIGIVRIGAEYSDIDEVMQDASRALRVSTQLGGRRATLFEPPMREQAKIKQALRIAIEDAISHHQIDLSYQPIVALESMLPVGFEALVRCPHLDQKGHDAELIFAVADSAGMLKALGKRVIELALAQIAAWQRQGVWSTGLFLSLNVCQQQLMDGRFLGYLYHASQGHGIDAAAIRLELSESSLGADLDWSHHLLPRLLNQHVRFGIDNFGIGPASLTMLTDLQPDYIKLDRRLVATLATSPRAQNLARMAWIIATETGSLLVAEGIETEDQLQALRELGLEHGQGHLIATPMSGSETASWLQLAARAHDRPRDEDSWKRRQLH